MAVKQILILFVLTISFGHNVVVVKGQQTRPDTTQVDVILLLDCSRSTKATDPESLRVRAARFLLAYLDTALTAKGATYRVGVANFGDSVGKTIALGHWPGKLVRDSLQVESFVYTDFAPPLRFALKELDDKRSFDQSNRRAVVLFTDGKPRLPHTEFFGVEKQHYFKGGPIAGSTANYPLAQIVHELQDSAVKVYMIAIGAERQDADLWQRLIPSYHYQPIDPTTNLSEVYRKLFGDLFDVGITLQNGENERTLSQKLQQTERWLWLVALLLVIAIIALVAQIRKNAKSHKQYEQEKETLVSTITGLKSQLTQLQNVYNQLQEEYARFREQYKQEKTNWESEREQWKKDYKQTNDEYFKFREEYEREKERLKAQYEEWQNKDSAQKVRDAIESLKKEVNALIEEAKQEKELEKKNEKLEQARRRALNFDIELEKAEKELADVFQQILFLRLENYKKIDLKGNLNDQRKLIRAEAAADANTAQIRGLANVLYNRWIFEPKLMMEEFYDVLCQPKGLAVMKVLSSIEPENEWDNYLKRRAENVRLMADTYCNFSQSGRRAA